MVFVRQQIVLDASCALSRAVCIATRYSAVRRQFGSHDGSLETQVNNLSRVVVWLQNVSLQTFSCLFSQESIWATILCSLTCVCFA